MAVAVMSVVGGGSTTATVEEEATTAAEEADNRVGLNLFFPGDPGGAAVG
jgi:hypothetical protein